jgi:hypothetical protein
MSRLPFNHRWFAGFAVFSLFSLFAIPTGDSSCLGNLGFLGFLGFLSTSAEPVPEANYRDPSGPTVAC